MDSATSLIQCTNDGFFDPVAACMKKAGMTPEKRSPTEAFQSLKLNGVTVQECRNPNKTDGPAKALYSNLHLPIGKDNSPLISRSFERGRNHSDNIYDLGVSQETNDGTDSGIEVIRALSSNGSNSDRFTPIQSCGSSLVSYSSEPEADRGSECGSESSEKSRVRKGSNCCGQGPSCWKSKKTYERSRVGRKINGYDGTSESCSETSSTHEAVTPDQLSRSLDFKRSASNRLHESKKNEKAKCSTVRRSESSTRNSSHDKTGAGSHASARSSSTAGRACSGSSSFPSGRNVKSCITGKCDSKGNKTKTEDARRSSSQISQTNGARKRVSSVADPSRKINLVSMSCSMTSSLNAKMSEGKSNALDKYGTLPRRPKRKSADAANLSVMQTSFARSHSVTREPSLNRAANLRRQQSREKENSSNCRSLPPYPRARRGTGKILIYHEIGVQTVITQEDISSSSAGVSIKDKPTETAPETEDKEIQTEGKERLKIMEENYTKQCEEMEKVRKENEELKSEKEKMVLRICKLLGHSESGQEELREGGLEELEKHFQAVGLTVIKQQEELSELRHYKLIAHRDLEKSLAAQKNLLQQQQEIEEEYSELQEFLQAEKTALSESLLDTEQELNRLRSEVALKQSLLERQQEECKNLVRICEERRQENLSLEAKLAGLDQRSRDVLVQQGAAVSAAAVALSGLGARLESLVEQLSTSCNIKEKDLENVVFRNGGSDESRDGSSDEPSPSRELGEGSKRKEAFARVILDAIKNATRSPFPLNTNGDDRNLSVSDQDETFLDAEMESTLNFENSPSTSAFGDEKEFLDSETIDLAAKKRSDGVYIEIDAQPKALNYPEERGKPIFKRLMEISESSVTPLYELIPGELNCLADQFVDVDNLVSKLLKVIRVIQGILEPQVDEVWGREKLQQEINRCTVESNMENVKQELMEAMGQLNSRIGQLEEVGALSRENKNLAVFEMQKRFCIIDSSLGTDLISMVDQWPHLVKAKHEFKDFFQRTAPITDDNGNSATNGTELR